MEIIIVNLILCIMSVYCVQGAVVSFKHQQVADADTIAMIMYGMKTPIDVPPAQLNDTCVPMELALTGFYWFDSPAKMTRNATHYQWTTQCKVKGSRIKMKTVMSFDSVNNQYVLYDSSIQPRLEQSERIPTRAQFTFDNQDTLIQRGMIPCWYNPVIPSALSCTATTGMYCRHNDLNSETHLFILDEK